MGGQRNKAIIEVLFSCGLRVSELVNLKLSNLFEEEKFVRILGKGNKERLVPISQKALDELHAWYGDRNKMNINRVRKTMFSSIAGALILLVP